MKTLLLLISVSVLAESAVATDWGCYDPKPMHPTSKEKASFVDRVSDLALAAEKKYGVPAPAIAAMTIAESGYGWTRTALEANNYFGWKYNSASAAGGRGYYVLDCQPAYDVNNKYIRFADDSDAVNFVAGKLASLPAYKNDTQRYQQAIKSAASPMDASRAWVAGISDPYNWAPAKYTRTITRIMNNPLAPSDEVSPQSNLYRLTARHKPEDKLTPPVENRKADVLLGEARRLYAGKIGKNTGRCDPAVNDYPRWKGYPVQLCDYHEGEVTVRTYMLNPSSDQLAIWTLTACSDANAKNVKRCINAVATQVIRASSGVFPVSGFIPEPAGSGGGTGSKIVCFVFQDGVTVNTSQFPKSQPGALAGRCPVLDRRLKSHVQDSTHGSPQPLVVSTELTVEQHLSALIARGVHFGSMSSGISTKRPGQATATNSYLRKLKPCMHNVHSIEYGMASEEAPLTRGRCA